MGAFGTGTRTGCESVYTETTNDFFLGFFIICLGQCGIQDLQKGAAGILIPGIDGVKRRVSQLEFGGVGFYVYFSPFTAAVGMRNIEGAL